jgi:transposase
MERVSTIGLDLAKNVFQVHGVDAAGLVVVKRKLSRGKLLSFFQSLSPCLVGMEACGTSHYWGREIAALGHEVKLMAPAYVKPYVKRQKNDAADAEAICEAVTRPSMRFVPVKGAEQQAALCLHRTRELLVGQRTRLANALRSHMAEFGIIVAKGIERVWELAALSEEEKDSPLPAAARLALQALGAEGKALDAAIAKIEAEIKARHKASEVGRRLATIPGIGPITASALVATLGEKPAAFRSARHFAAWIGLVPREYSSGGKQRLGRISRQGDRYLRKLLVLGATSVMRCAGKTDPWLKSLLERKHFRLVSVALANKMARIVFAVMSRGETYRTPLPATA